jgi:hypothetical protein
LGRSVMIALSWLLHPVDTADGGEFFGLVLSGLGEVEGGLEAQPQLRAAAEGFGEAQRHFGGDAAAFVNEGSRV